MIENKAKRTLAAGRPVLAITLNFVHAGLAEYLARLGFECIVVDGEHGAVNDDEVEQVARACELADATLLMRLPVNDPMMQRYLGIGCGGFHVPQIRSVAQAREALDAIKFAPAGRRGLGSFRAADYGLTLGGWPNFIERANKETLVAIAFEDPEGLAVLPEAVKLPGVDVVLIGTSDLSASLGVPGQTKHEKVVKLRDEAIAAARAAGKVVGLPASSAADIVEAYELGARFILTSVARALPVGSTTLLDAIGKLAKAGA